MTRASACPPPASGWVTRRPASSAPITKRACAPSWRRERPSSGADSAALAETVDLSGGEAVLGQYLVGVLAKVRCPAGHRAGCLRQLHRHAEVIVALDLHDHLAGARMGIGERLVD